MPRPRSSMLLRFALVPATAVLFMAADCGDGGGPSTANVIGVRVQNGLANTISLEVHVFGESLGDPTDIVGNGAYVDELAGDAGDRISFTAHDNSGTYADGTTSCEATAAITSPSTGTPQQYGQANVLPGETPTFTPLRIQCSSGWAVND